MKKMERKGKVEREDSIKYRGKVINIKIFLVIVRFRGEGGGGLQRSLSL